MFAVPSTVRFVPFMVPVLCIQVIFLGRLQLDIGGAAVDDVFSLLNTILSLPETNVMFFFPSMNRVRLHTDGLFVHYDNGLVLVGDDYALFSP